MKNVKTARTLGIETITLNRPLRRNAFDANLIVELTEAFAAIRDDGAVRAVVLTGEGTSFCAGGDLEWMKSATELTHDENIRDAELLFDMFKTIRDVPVPVIAKVFGHCFGGGLGLIAACDIVAAESATQFCFSEVKWGLVPAVISPFVREKALPGHMREWFLTAKTFDAPEAGRGGLVNFCGTMGEVETFVERTGHQIRESAPGAVAAAKRLHQSFSPVDWTTVRQMTTALIADRRVSKEGQDGLACFLGKTKPDWTLGSKGAFDKDQ
jgi:methylglutaconyl-CoA hydratase